MRFSPANVGTDSECSGGLSANAVVTVPTLHKPLLPSGSGTFLLPLNWGWPVTYIDQEHVMDWFCQFPARSIRDLAASALTSVETMQRSLTTQEGEAMKKDRGRVSWARGLPVFPRLGARHVGEATFDSPAQKSHPAHTMGRKGKPSMLSLAQAAKS